MKIRISVLIFALIAMSLVMAIINSVIREHDTETTVATQRILAGVIQHERQRLGKLALDYAYWNDAIAHLLYRFDEEWAAQNIGAHLAKNHGIAFSVVWGAGDRPLISYTEGVLKERPLFDISHRGIRDLSWRPVGRAPQRPPRRW